MELPVWLHPQGDAVLLDVLVAPRAARTRVIGVHEDRLKIQLTAAPVHNKANEALVRFLAQSLGVARACVEIVGGPSSRRKTVRILGVSAQKVALKLVPSSR
jgi:uncharacterized protein (TIGR00251 family)